MSNEAKASMFNSNEWKTPVGQLLNLCVLCEMDTNKDYSVQSICIVKGKSVCREHMLSELYVAPCEPPLGELQFRIYLSNISNDIKIICYRCGVRSEGSVMFNELEVFANVHRKMHAEERII